MQCLGPLGGIHPCDPLAGLGNGLQVLSEDFYFCVTDCELKGEDSTWCWVYSGWSYCNPRHLLNQHITVRGTYCTYPCAQNGEKYFWCRTGGVGVWDYCAPSEYCPEPSSLSQTFL